MAGPTVSTKSPGVKIAEISTLPASVAEVATAIPAFIGYTRKRSENGASFASGVPKRITSFLEFEAMFGTAFAEILEITLNDPEPGNVSPRVSITPKTTLSPFVLYYQVKWYFENGGGPCYIVSVGAVYDAVAAPTSANIVKTDLLAGLTACEKEDEITLLCAPEASWLSDGGIKDLYDAMLAQCAKLQDRFAILDAKANPSNTIVQDADNFRNNNVGADNLKYGATYYPQIQTTIAYNYDLASVKIKSDLRMHNSVLAKAIYNNKDLAKVIDTVAPLAAVAADATITINATTAAGHVLVVNGYSFPLSGASINAIAAQIKTDIDASADVNADVSVSVAANVATITAKTAGSAGNRITLSYNPLGKVPAVTLSSNALVGGFDSIDMPLYNAIKSSMDNYNVPMYPCGAIAGVYARVDFERGVWKAPANVGVRRIDKPLTNVSDADQEGLNVDAGSGKSINVIRNFTGKGNLIWGARTLAGNDNEWRYVPVRRLYIMVEESVKKATEFVVFEPNDANTWNRVKTMIGNYLTRLWREGALAGAKPEDAFFVKVGLGQTMTADDILNGIMNVEIGMAAVRPAEFIVLKFSHKLAVS
jgi:uncharacterized protein